MAEKVDVLICGSGSAELCAAIRLARCGINYKDPRAPDKAAGERPEQSGGAVPDGGNIRELWPLGGRPQRSLPRA